MSTLNANAEPFVVASASNRATTSAANGTSKLSAYALSFVMQTSRVQHYAIKQGRPKSGSSSDERSLFMTFSTGSPLTREEIFHYFTSVFGQCVERVYVHDQFPEFGKITFTTSIMAEMILLNNKLVKLLVNNKPIWLKKYVPRSQRKFKLQQ